MDKIFFKNITLPCKVGVSEKERKKSQKIMIDLVIFRDLKEAGEEDEISKTVNYSEVLKGIKRLVKNKEFNLIESVAENVASFLIKSFRVDKVKVRVRKERFGLSPAIGVEIVR